MIASRLIRRPTSPVDPCSVVCSLSARRASIGASVLAGLVVAGIVGVILVVIELPAGNAAGAFVGGLVAAWLLYARPVRAATAGFLVGLFSFPVQLSILMALVSLRLYTPPPVPEIPQDVFLVALGLTVVLEVAGGTVGGLLGGIVHHPPRGVVETRRPYMPPPPPHPEKYCIQCGAGLAKQTLVCPACGARQPQ